MQLFRSPKYLNTDELVPLANYHDIDVMTDVEFTQRDSSERAKGAGAKISVPIPGSPSLEANTSKGSSTEVTQSRKISDHPSGALNRLIDTLEDRRSLETNASLGRKRQLVELEREWEISPATDVANIFSAMIRGLGDNPSIFDGPSVPNEFVGSFLNQDKPTGPVVLDSKATSDQPRAIALLNPAHLVKGYTVDDLEGEVAVFGQVESYKGEDQTYSLDKFFLAGVNRAARRAFELEGLLENAHKIMGRTVSMDEVVLTGPLLVVKAIAVY